MQIRSAKYNKSGTVDCEIDHPVHGWIPFTASPSDVEKRGRDIFSELSSGGRIAPYVAPPLPTAEEVLASKRSAAVLTRREFFQALDIAGLYDSVMSLKTDPATPRATIIDLETAATFERNWPTLIQAAQQLGLSDTQIDALFGIV